jgi:hypothetical protein
VLSSVASVEGCPSSCSDSAASKSEAPGGGERIVLRPDDGETYLEWQAGVLSADKPAVSAMCSDGRGGSEKSL